MKSDNKIAFVGRVNVGKSTLFNRLASSSRALVYDFEGVTRDPLHDECTWAGVSFTLVDTAGFSRSAERKQLLNQAFFTRTLDELSTAYAVILVIDGSVGVTPDDHLLISRIRESGKPIIVAVTKSDIAGSEFTIHEVYGLGFNRVVLVSGAHGRGIEDLLEQIVSVLPKQHTHISKTESSFSIALLGRPNVGKSSLLNKITGKERAVVSDTAGTTREALRMQMQFYQQVFHLVDTAGVRRSRSIDDPLEHLMVGSTFQAADASQIIILVLDASAGDVVDQELKLAYYAFSKLHKALLIVWNKVDLIAENAVEHIREIEKKYHHLFSRVPSLQVPCLSGKNIGRVMHEVAKLIERYQAQLPSYEVQQLFLARLAIAPLMHNKEPLKLFRAYQINAAPMTFYLQVNEPLWVGDSERAFFENILRKNFDLKGISPKWIVRKK